MRSRTPIKVLICLIIRLSVIELSNAEDDPTSLGSTEHSVNTNEHKLILECQHPDYRTYIKCLKRQKRHHWHNEHESTGGDTRKCFDECGMEQCESTKCVHDCHKHCMKKTKETRQIITQYETECLSDDCRDKSEKNELPTTNVTTNIDINNVINNHMPKPVEGSSSGGGGSGGSSVGTGGSGGPGGSGGGTGVHTGTSNWPCTPGYSNCNTGFSLVPQIQFVPQITFGLGINSFSGGYFPNPQPAGIDCSSCGNPFMRYRCDVSCYSVQASGSSIPNTGRPVGIGGNCIAPHCVGGT